MKPNYTLKDVQTLLLQKFPKLNWNYEIYENRTGEKIRASIEDFIRHTQGTVGLACLYGNNEFPLYVSVSDFSFLVFEDETDVMGSGSTIRLRNNFTNDWTSLLLKKYGYDYAKQLVNYCEKCKKQINDNAMQEITKLVQKVKARAEQEALPYEQLIQKAKNILPTSNFTIER